MTAMSPRKSAAEARTTRERIVSHSAAIASVEGLQGLTIGRLAADLGMSKAGVLGHFGTKQALQLAALDGAAAVFTRLVWEPAADIRGGLDRLNAVCEAWITYLEREREAFPGGCLFTTASIEFDARGGPVHDEVARLFRMWSRRLMEDVRIAVANGELPADADPEQIVFELVGTYMAFNQAIQLFADPQAPNRMRKAIQRLLTTPTPALTTPT